MPGTTPTHSSSASAKLRWRSQEYFPEPGETDSYRLLKRKSTLRESLKRHSLLVTFSAASFLKDLPCPSRSLQRLVSERLMSIAVRAFDFYPAEGHFYPRDARHENGHRLSVAPR